MPRKTPVIEVELMPGKKYSDLESAQRAALPTLADDMAQSIRRMLAEGWLINDNGRIIPNPERIESK